MSSARKATMTMIMMMMIMMMITIVVVVEHINSGKGGNGHFFPSFLYSFVSFTRVIAP